MTESEQSLHLPGIERYAHNHTSPELPVLAKLARATHLRTHQPQMLSGHLQGTLLQMLSHMVNPSAILEIGTFTGYSAICLAQGLKPGEFSTLSNVILKWQSLLHPILKKQALKIKSK